jgi:NAD+ synthase
MRLTSSVLDIDLVETSRRIARFIRDYVENSGVEGIVLGLSGGVDSNTVAALSSLSIGGGRVLGIMLPEEETYSQRDTTDAVTVAQKFGLKTQLCDISQILRSLYETIPTFDKADKLCKGNVKARTRMICLYYYANKLNRIVCGSSDKSETMMGYFTKWGDAAADISPIMDLYKTQVRRLGVHLGLPPKLAEKPSTPRLWPKQYAETELGVKYETIDLVLYGLERFMGTKEIANQLGIKLALVDRIRNRWLKTEHKRRMPMAPKLEFRTVGNDFRIPRSAF